MPGENPSTRLANLRSTNPVNMEILYEDNHCLAIVKPCGFLSTHFQGREQTLDRMVKGYLKDRYHKPGNVFLGIVHRLDRPVSGVLLFARTSKAAARIAEQFRMGTVEKVYWAVVEGAPVRATGSLEDWLLKDRAQGRVRIVDPQVPGARKALLHYQRRAEHGGLAWVEIQPQTGRTHQLRVQLAHEGHVIYGDSRYGSVHPFGQGIALHARSLTFLHPIQKEPITLTAPIPRDWQGRFSFLFREVEP